MEREAFIATVLDVLSASRSPMRCKDVVAALGGDAEVPREADSMWRVGWPWWTSELVYERRAFPG